MRIAVVTDSTASLPPEDVAAAPESHTGRYLAPMLRPARVRAAE